MPPENDIKKRTEKSFDDFFNHPENLTSEMLVARKLLGVLISAGGWLFLFWMVFDCFKLHRIFDIFPACMLTLSLIIPANCLLNAVPIGLLKKRVSVFLFIASYLGFLGNMLYRAFF